MRCLCVVTVAGALLGPAAVAHAQANGEAPFTVRVLASANEDRSVSLRVESVMAPWAQDPAVWGPIAERAARLTVTVDREPGECPTDPLQPVADAWIVTGTPYDPSEEYSSVGDGAWWWKFTPGPNALGDFRVCATLAANLPAVNAADGSSLLAAGEYLRVGRAWYTRLAPVRRPPRRCPTNDWEYTLANLSEGGREPVPSAVFSGSVIRVGIGCSSMNGPLPIRVCITRPWGARSCRPLTLRADGWASIKVRTRWQVAGRYTVAWGNRGRPLTARIGFRTYAGE